MRLCAAGLTVTDGVISGVTVTVADPDPPAYTLELVESGEKVAVNFALPAVSEPAGMLIVPLPLLRICGPEV